jgi:hypothetical protein
VSSLSPTPSFDRILQNVYRLALDGPSTRKIQAGETETALPVADLKDQPMLDEARQY